MIFCVRITLFCNYKNSKVAKVSKEITMMRMTKKRQKEELKHLTVTLFLIKQWRGMGSNLWIRSKAQAISN